MAAGMRSTMHRASLNAGGAQCQRLTRLPLPGVAAAAMRTAMISSCSRASKRPVNMSSSGSTSDAHCSLNAGISTPAIHATALTGAAARWRASPAAPTGRRSVAAAAASDAAAVPDPSEPKAEQQQQQQQPDLQQQQPKASSSGGGRSALWWTLGAVAAVALGGFAFIATGGDAAALKATLVDGPLGRSGFLAAFSLIFLSEIGDKTFFIAALLAMRLGRLIAFAGSLAALAAMTVISVAIGVVFSRVPDALMTSLPVGEVAGVALLVVFGVKALRAAYAAGGDGGGGGAEEELQDAQSAVAEAESSGKVRARGAAAWASLLEVASLVFLAEWGDRSMLATIALGAAQNPLGVAIGATAGHAAATAIAVIGGAIAGQHVSERTVNAISGVLFLVFAAATLFTML